MNKIVKRLFGAAGPAQAVESPTLDRPQHGCPCCGETRIFGCSPLYQLRLENGSTITEQDFTLKCGFTYRLSNNGQVGFCFNEVPFEHLILDQDNHPLPH